MIEMQVEETKDLVVRPLLLTIPQVMACLSLGRNTVYDLIEKEGLPVHRFGRAIRVSYDELRAWLAQRGQRQVIQ